MTLHATENAFIAAQGVSPRTAAILTDVDVDATITIWDIGGATKLVDEAAMAYDADLEDEDWDEPGGFYYVWASEATAGAYPAKVTFTGTGDPDIFAFEYKTARLRAKKSFDT